MVPRYWEPCLILLWHVSCWFLITVDSSVVATFFQHCRSSVHANSLKAANLEYVGWVEEILAVDYGRYDLVVLYCNWVMTNTVGHNAIMKRDDYGFSLVNFDRLVSLSAESFAFPLHIEHIFFADDLNNHGWKVVLQKSQGEQESFLQEILNQT